jgi:hypothetical protein
MNDDDTERFPRITLWQFLGGLFRGLASLLLWFSGEPSPLTGGRRDKRRDPPPASNEPKSDSDARSTS